MHLIMKRNIKIYDIMKKRTMFLLIPIFFTATSCKDFLDTTPEDGIGSLEMWTTPEHAALGIVGAYSPMKSFSQGADPYNPAGCIASNPVTDAYTKYAFAWGTGFDDTGCRYFCNNSATTGYGVFLSKWKADYTGVQYANLAIENISRMEEILDEDQFNKYLGEAHFLRALYYFDLLTYYSGHKTSDPGIPLYTSMPDYDKAYRPRATPANVRKVMIDDLEKAASLLPYRSYEKGRASRSAALVLLGKVYLYSDNFAKAAEIFSALVEENNNSSEPYSLYGNYENLFKQEGENNNEAVFVIDCLNTYGNGSRLDLLYSNRSANCSGTNTSIPTRELVDAFLMSDGTPFNGVYPDWTNRDAVNQFFKNRDPRLDASIIRPFGLFVGKDNLTYEYRSPYDTKTSPYPCMRSNHSSNTNYCWRKFCNEGNETVIRRHSGIDIPLIRWADVLLLYAESLNESAGPSNAVFDALDAIRTRAKMPKVSRSGGQEEVRQLIRNERVYELAGEGHLYPDWQRWFAHNDSDFDYESLTNQPIAGYDGVALALLQVSTRNFTKRNWRYAIPQTEIDINPALVQSDGWGN